VDIFLHDPTTDSLVAVGVSDTPMGRRQKSIGLDRLPLANGGPAVEVYRSGISYYGSHNDEDPTQLRGVWDGMGALSSLDVALDVGGERRGVLEIDAAMPDAFTTEDQRFIEVVARWVGMVAQRDLRTPLTPARGYLDLLRQRALTDGRELDVGYADQAVLALARLRRMIDSLLDAGRLEQGLFALDLRPVDVAALVRETVDTLRTPGAVLAVRGPSQLVAERVDPERLRQALENLIGNAVAHSPEGTPVAVEVAEERREDGFWVVLSVHDEGPGIAQEALPTLFDRFARGAGSGGLGMGLYLARGIVTAHGGMLTVETRLGVGTTFCLAVPRASHDSSVCPQP